MLKTRGLLFNKKKNVSYNEKIQPKDIEYFHNIYFCDKTVMLKTKTDINKHGYFKFGVDISQILNTYKTPIAENFLSGSNKIKTLHFKQKIAYKKATCEFSFFNKKLFHFTYCFKYLSERDKLEMTNLLSLKYLNSESNIDGSKIIDQNGNIIFIDDTFYLNISYFSGHNEVKNHIEQLQSKANLRLNIKKKSEFKELYRML